ncbi:tetratricopeptide repeat protein [Candidatus Uhrbacteria bacterium]|nr:tetratricopeptide repeat protein [Candidatus Uhrbacteria bacterium]
MSTRRTWKTACFSYKDVEELKDLGDGFCRLGHGGDSRVIVLLERALALLEACLAAADADERRESVIEEFAEAVGHDLGFIEDRLVDACLDLGRYAKGLAVCGLLEKIGSRDPADILHDRVEFLTCLGRAEEAERLLLTALARRPDDAWIYIALGDLSFSYEPQREHRDILRAESWYYRAYDRGLADESRRGGQVLLERLREACVARLRGERETRLLAALERCGIGGRQTIADLAEEIRTAGTESVLLHHLAAEFDRHGAIAPGVRHASQLLTDFYEHVPQEAFGGYSHFEMSEYFPVGEHEARIRNEASYVVRRGTGSFAGHDNDPRSVARLATLQDEFFEGRDVLTGKERRRVIADERKKTRKLFEEGKLPWKGFLKHRPKVPDLFAHEDFSGLQSALGRKGTADSRTRHKGAGSSARPKK